MATLTWSMALMFAGGVAGQLVGLSLMPETKGLTAPLPTIGCAVAFLVGLGLLTRLVASGAPMSILVPLNAVAIPLGSLAISVLLLGESVSIGRLVALIAAAGLIGVASAI